MKIIIDETRLRKAIREQIDSNERMLSDLYRYLSQEPTENIHRDGKLVTTHKAYNYFEPRKIVHDAWAVHYTCMEGFEGILERGFSVGTPNYDELAYSGNYYESGDGNRPAGWNFALPVDNKYLGGDRGYGDMGFILKLDGVRAYHKGDHDDEIIFQDCHVKQKYPFAYEDQYRGWYLYGWGDGRPDGSLPPHTFYAEGIDKVLFENVSALIRFVITHHDEIEPVNEIRLRTDIRETLLEGTGSIRTYYRGFDRKDGPGYRNGRFTHETIWITPNPEYAKMYGDTMAEILVDESMLAPASLYDIDELVDYDFEYDGLQPDDVETVLGMGFNCYELEYDKYGSSGIYLMDPACIKGMRILSDEERNAVEDLDEINETHARRLIPEYLDKMTSDAMRSLGTEDKPSQLAMDTNRYLGRDLYDPRRGETGILKNAWLIHITGSDDARSIVNTGFKSKVKNLDFRATQDVETELADDGLCFGCVLSDTNSWGQIIDQAKDNDIDWCGVVFQANAFMAQSFFGYLNVREVVFSAESAHNFLLLIPMTDAETEKYLKYHRLPEGVGFQGVKLVGSNGRTLFEGDIDTLIARHNKENIFGRLDKPSYAEDYLDSNLGQYRRNMWNPRCQSGEPR